MKVTNYIWSTPRKIKDSEGQTGSNCCFAAADVN